VLATLGQYDKAVDACRQGIRLAPDRLSAPENLTNALLALQRLDETRQVIEQARQRKMDDLVFRNALYALAFLTVMR
jgi:tetratricopeptide (TPR) repeat protein